MKKYKVIHSALAAAALAMGGYSMAYAEESVEISDRQVCEQEADEAGLLTDQEVEDYVAQCLEDIQAQNEESTFGVE